MNFNLIFKLFSVFSIMLMFSLTSFATEANSLSKIVVDKPIDNSYQLGLYFKDKFQGNAFIQKKKNGSFYVFIPDAVMTSKNIRVIYKNKVKKSDIKIDISEQPYVKENQKSKYVRLSIETPVNSSIELTANKTEPGEIEQLNSKINLYNIIGSILVLLAIFVLVGILWAVKSIRARSNSYTSFPLTFLEAHKKYTKNTNKNMTYEKLSKADVSAKTISPISANDFSCFDLPLEHQNKPFSSSLDMKTVTNPNTEEKIVKNSSLPNNYIEELELDLPSAEHEAIIPEEKGEPYRPELISELKISSDKGFYLTTVGNSSFALFGYIGEKIFFLQKFTDLAQINLQARFYDSKDGYDLYIVRLDSYKAMLAVSDTDIKELAVI